MQLYVAAAHTAHAAALFEIAAINARRALDILRHGGRGVIVSGILIGRSLLHCHNPHSNSRIQEVVDWFAASPEHNIIYTYHNEKQNKDVYMVALRDADGTLIGYYEKHAFRSPETMERYAF